MISIKEKVRRDKSMGKSFEAPGRKIYSFGGVSVRRIVFPKGEVRGGG